MYTRRFQGGTSVEILSATGRDPLESWNVSSKKHVKKIYEKEVRGFVFECGGSTQTKMSLPASEADTLGLVQPFLVLQLQLSSFQPFSICVVMESTRKTKHRVILSTSFKDISINPLHVQLPLSVVKRGSWLNLCLDLQSIMKESFKDQFRCLDAIEIRSYCKIRRIFTMKAPLMDDTDDAKVYGWKPTYQSTGFVSRIHDYPVGVAHKTQVLSMDKILLAKGTKEMSHRQVQVHKGRNGRAASRAVSSAGPRLRSSRRKTTLSKVSGATMVTEVKVFGRGTERSPKTGRRASRRFLAPNLEGIKDGIGAGAGAGAKIGVETVRKEESTYRPTARKSAGYKRSTSIQKARLSVRKSEPSVKSELPANLEGSTENGSLKHRWKRPAPLRKKPRDFARSEEALPNQPDEKNMGRYKSKQCRGEDANREKLRNISDNNSSGSDLKQKKTLEEGKKPKIRVHVERENSIEEVVQPLSSRTGGYNLGLSLDNLELESPCVSAIGTAKQITLSRRAAGDMVLEDAANSDDWAVSSPENGRGEARGRRGRIGLAQGGKENLSRQGEGNKQHESIPGLSHQNKADCANENPEGKMKNPNVRDGSRDSVGKSTEGVAKLRQQKHDENRRFSESPLYGPAKLSVGDDSSVRPFTSNTMCGQLAPLSFGNERLMTPPIQLDSAERSNRIIPGVLDGRQSPTRQFLDSEINVSVQYGARPSTVSSDHGKSEMRESRDGGSMVKLMYDPVLECYYDPRTNMYYQFDPS